jgi:hypothetical protein
MDARQSQFTRVVSSIAVGIVAFCATAFLALLVGGVLVGQLPSDALIPPELQVLFLISSIVGLILGVIAGVKYYRYTGKSR